MTDPANPPAPAPTPAAPAPAKPAAPPIATFVAGAPKPPATVQPVEQVTRPPPVEIDPSNQVTVQAVRSFQGEEGFKNPQSEPFAATRQRAADLFAVGLIEYVDAAEEDAAIDAAAEAEVAKVKAAAEGRRSKKADPAA